MVEAPGEDAGTANPGTLHMHDDPNDGKLGFGIMTNEPPFEYHLAKYTPGEIEPRSNRDRGEIEPLPPWGHAPYPVTCVTADGQWSDPSTRSARHLQWKRTLVRQAVTVPGTWYPEERFMRVLMVKQGMPPPKSMQTAVAQAVGVLNTITVPMGSPPGTDSGPTSVEHGDFDHSVFGVIRDHADPTFYYRSAYNPSLQRVRLSAIQSFVILRQITHITLYV